MSEKIFLRLKQNGVYVLVCLLALLSPFIVSAQSSSEICQGDSVQLRPTVPYETIEWRDASGNVLTKIDGSGVEIPDTAPWVSPTSDETYTARIVNQGANNLIPWGDFESTPPLGFQAHSDYRYYTGPDPEGFYADAATYARGFFTVTHNAALLHDQTQFPTCPTCTYKEPWYLNTNDNTTGSGNMFAANGSTDPASEVIKATVPVKAGTTYIVSAWFANIHVGHLNPYKMDIYIDGNYHDGLEGTSAVGWYNHFSFWTATVDKDIDVVFRNTRVLTPGGGNDFAIDDIIFSPIVTETYDVVLKPGSAANITASKDIGCSPLVIDFSTQTADSYQWSFGDGTTSNEQAPQKTFISPVDTVFDVKLEVVGNNQCNGTDSMEVTIEGIDLKFEVDNYIKRYPEATFTVHNRDLDTGTDYTWVVYNNDSAQAPFKNSSEYFDITVDTEANAINEYNIRMVSENPRCKDSTTRQVTVFPFKSVTPDSIDVSHSDLEGCVPFTVYFTLNDSQDFDTVVWLVDGVEISGGNTFSYDFTSEGYYYVSINATKPTGVNVTNSYEVIASEIDTINFEVINTPAEVMEEEVQFQSKVSADSVIWSFGDGNTSTEFHPRHIYEDAGLYDVQLVASRGMCSDTIIKSEVVEIIDNSYITFPNAFAPSEDSPSDGSYPLEEDVYSNVFHPHFNGINKYELRIFNQWGEEIFVSEDIEVGWNGKYANEGNKVTQGVYFWKSVGTFHNDKDWERGGSVTVIWQ